MLSVTIGYRIRRCQSIRLELNPVNKPLLIVVLILIGSCNTLDHLFECDLDDSLVPAAILAEVDLLAGVEHATVHIIIGIEEILLDLLLDVLRLLIATC